MGNKINYRDIVFEKLGGPILPEDMDKIPTLEQWLRYWLYRMDFEEAVVNAVQMKMDSVRSPKLFNEDDHVAYKLEQVSDKF